MFQTHFCTSFKSSKHDSIMQIKIFMNIFFKHINHFFIVEMSLMFRFQSFLKHIPKQTQGMEVNENK